MLDARDQVLGGGAAVGGEAVGEIGRKGIGVIGVAVVAEVPDRDDPRLIHGVQQRVYR